MKEWLAIIIITILLSSCKERDFVEVESEDITGRWLWEGTGGGFGGGGGYFPKNGERVIVQFDSKGNFSMVRNDSLILQGKYRIEPLKSIYGDKMGIFYEAVPQSNTLYHLGQVVIGPVILSLTNKKLSTGDNYYDGFGSSFIKTK